MTGKGLKAGPSPVIRQGIALLQQGRSAEAAALLKREVARAPRDHAALHLLGVITRERGDHDGAIDLLRRAIALEGRLAPYHGNLGNAYLMSSQFAAAAACYRTVLAMQPGLVLARYGLGMALLGLEKFAACVPELEAVAKAEPNHADAHANLGVALSALERHDDAMRHFERALALMPRNAAFHFKCGMALRRQGDLAAACRHLARAAALDPKLAEASCQVGVVLHAMGRLDDAAVALRDALKLDADSVAALYELGQVLNRLQGFDEASACFERALALDPDAPALLQGLARTRHLQGRCEEARALISAAIAHGGDAADCSTVLGLIHQSEGHFEQAIAAYRHAIAVNPSHGQAHLCLAMIDGADDPAAHVVELERIAELGTLDADQHATLEYALAKEHERLGNHDAAFSRYQSANDLRRAQYPYDAQENVDATDRLIAAFPERADTAGGSDSERPVFIVGMMRSGTTLVEQILASHPDVHGHGELEHIGRLASGLQARMGSAQAYPECVSRLDDATIQTLATDYLARLEQDAPNAARSIDKLPHNFEHLGLIARLFPKARIIHCTRDPIDTCLSIYFHDFGSDHRFSYDLGALGQFHQQYRRLMAHWQTVLPNPILDVPYEALVADQEGWSRKLVDFLGLPWDNRCLKFYDNDRPVYTYSLQQVRQPIYTRSIARWRPYAGRLGPLLDSLGSVG